jgi:hypothetical protein
MIVTSKLSLCTQATLLKQYGAQIITVGIGPTVDMTELEQVATDISHSFIVESFDVLKNVKDQLVSAACEGQ